MQQGSRRRGTTRLAGVIVAVGMVVTGCSGDGADAADDAADPTEAEATAPATRVVDTEMGEVEVPVDPQRVVALDEYAAMNALAFGIEPIEVWASYQSEVPGQILADAGIEVVEASVEGGVNVEAVAAADPDLVILTPEAALMDAYDDLSDFAPTLVLPYSRPWREVITTSAAAFGHEEDGAAIIATLEDRIAEVGAEIADDPPSMSILGDTMGMLFAMSNLAPLSHLVDEVGFTRPVAQAEGTPDPGYDAAVLISEEVLSDHDADLIVLLEGAYYRSQTFLDSPTFQTLPGAEAGHVFVVDGDMWAGSYPFAISWVLDDLAALAADDPDGIGTLEQVADRWAAFESELP